MDVNVLVLAYLGDSVYEVLVREYLISLGTFKVDELDKRAITFVSAKGQVSKLNYLLDNGLLTDDEIDIVKRGRNYKKSSHPKHTDVITYKLSTGFEAMIGWLYLNDKKIRIQEIFDLIKEI